MACIVSLRAQRFALPLGEVLSDAKHGDHTQFERITVHIGFEDGNEGTGYSYTSGKGGWFRLAALSRKHGVPVCSRGMQELHISLVSAQPNSGWGELHSFLIDRYTTRPVVLEDSFTVAPDTPGTGVVFDWGKLNAANDLAA